MGSAASPFSARCPTPFAFPFTPLGLSLFDIDPSRILNMLHHQTWLAEETLRNRGLLGNPKELPHRFTPLSELFGKEYHANNLHATATDLLSGATSATSPASGSASATATVTATATATATSLAASTSSKSLAAQLSPHSQQQYKQQPFGLRYPSPAAFFHHHHHHHTAAQRLKQTRPNTPSPGQTATSTQATTIRNESIIEELKRKSETNCQREDDDNVIELSSNDEMPLTPARTPSAASASMLYKESLEQLLQQRRRSSSSGISVGDNLRSYSQLLLSNTPSCTTDNSSCKEKSSSSSTSSTPPPTSALLAQHQHLSQMLKSPSDTSSLFSEPIEEETRCVVCNAHFPNVWLLEQHAALQHPHVGPGEEKPFICEQCGQSYRYRSAYAKHKEQNHRARLPADKLFTCDVCGMQFRYLKSFKKHRLNHALERLHGKKGTGGKYSTLPTPAPAHMDQDIVTSSQEALLAEESGEDLRINVKRERAEEDERERERDRERERGRERAHSREGDQDSTIDSAGIALLYNDNNSTASASTNSAAAEPTISSSDVIHSTNQRPRLLTTTHMETDPSYQHQHQHQHQAHHHHLQQSQSLPTHLHAAAAAAAAAAAVSPPGVSPLHVAAHTATAMSSLSSLNSITSLINAERIPNEQFLGLNPQEASILNFLRVDAAERQRDKRPPTSRFACPFCGKCVRSKENLKLHVRKHTGERPFVCLFCGRAFGGKSDLTRHLRIHTGERPYHCESCGKCFARADYLSKHLTTHIHNAPR